MFIFLLKITLPDIPTPEPGVENLSFDILIKKNLIKKLSVIIYIRFEKVKKKMF